MKYWLSLKQMELLFNWTIVYFYANPCLKTPISFEYFSNCGYSIIYISVHTFILLAKLIRTKLLDHARLPCCTVLVVEWAVS